MESIHPFILPTEGGLLELRGTHLAGARLSVDVQRDDLRAGVPQQREVSVHVLDDSKEGMVLADVGPGMGANVWLILENDYGKTRFSFSYEGKFHGQTDKLWRHFRLPKKRHG